MNEAQDQARVVVIGAGIVGNCIVGHLAQDGWRNILQIDKGSLPNPGGSTGHASNFIFPVDHSKEITMLTLDSQHQYEELGVQLTTGGIEIARTPTRLEELSRRMTSAMAWGIEAHLISPQEVTELVPFVNKNIILGGFYTPSVSVVDPLQAGTLMRERALSLGALTIRANTEVLDIEVVDGAVRAVITDSGRIETEYAVIACGVWSPRIAAMAGATIPLTPAVHQMIDVGPISVLQATGNEIGYPIVRDMDVFMYERQTGGNMEIGSYAHRPIFHHPDSIPSIQETQLSPTELPLTEEDFDPQLIDALELMPEILSNAEMKYGVNGLLSLTPDAMPVLGETVEVKNLWSAAAVWIKEGPGIARLISEWMTHGYPNLDPHSCDIARFYTHQRTEEHTLDRCSEHFNKTYGIVHPREEWESSRPEKISPFYARELALGATFFETGGWERPHWYQSNSYLLDRYQDRIPTRPHEWDSRWWSPIQNAEHLAMRDGVGIVDLSALAIFDFTGPKTVDFIQMMAVSQCDIAVGKAAYTPLLTANAGFRADLTIMRLGVNHYRVVTGSHEGARDEYWFRRFLPENGSVHMEDKTSSMCTIAIWGPQARELVQKVTNDRIANSSFPYGTVRKITIGSIPTLMYRISYVGELGWEVYTDTENGLALWDILWEAGQELDAVPVGAGVYGTTGRLEKSYRLMGAELNSEYNPIEAGLAKRKIKTENFIGKAAYTQELEKEPAAILCTMTMEDHSSESGLPRFPTGGNEPILTADDERIVDTKERVSYVTSAGAGPSVSKYLLLGYLPPAYAVKGTDLQVLYQNSLFPIRVAAVGNTPLFDPDNLRMRQ